MKFEDAILINEETAFDSLDLIVNNSKYQPEYIKSLYIIDFYRTLMRVEKRIKNQK